MEIATQQGEAGRWVWDDQRGHWVDTAETDVVTYQTPDGTTRVAICAECERRLLGRGEWPRGHSGDECSQVYYGRHRGVCRVCHPAG